MKYYTYLHRRKDNGEVFYVGQGCNRRAFRSWHHDNKDWHRVADVVGYSIEIIDHFNTKKEALDAEYLLIQEHKDNGWLVNKIGGNILPGTSYQAKNPRGRYNTKINSPATLKAKGYTLVQDIWVKLHHYYSRLRKNPNNDCIEVYKGGLHSQGYMMISVIRDSDMKRMMVTGHRIAARIKEKRAIREEEYVIKTCSNMRCHNPAHLIIGDKADLNTVMTKNKRWANRRPGSTVYNRPRYDRPDVPTPSELLYVINHTIPECVARFGWTERQIKNIQHNYNRGSYKWLPHFDNNGDLKPEWEWLYKKK